jgi:hypothetical protein
MTQHTPRDSAAIGLLADLEEITRENHDMCLDEIAGHLADRRWRQAPVSAVQRREEQAADEARPHDDEDAELRADRHAEITEAERSEEVLRG